MNENNESGKSRVRICVLAAAVIFLLFTAYYVIMALLSPGRKISGINNEFRFKTEENSAFDERILSDSTFIKINRDKAFLQARITMAETDSISLSLNLSDSTAALEINGVNVHRAKMTLIRISSVFNKADEYSVTSMLATPFTVKNDFSTIKKEPLMIKIAPKDTSEYQPDILPDTSNVAPVNYILEMENGFRLYVYESFDNGKKGRLARFTFDLADRFRNSLEITKSIITFKIPEYHPSVRIMLPKADARIIYRGLPAKGQVALFR